MEKIQKKKEIQWHEWVPSDGVGPCARHSHAMTAISDPSLMNDTCEALRVDKGHAVTYEVLKSSEDVVRIRTFGKSSYPGNIFKSSYVTPCPFNEAMYIVFCTVPIGGSKHR